MVHRCGWQHASADSREPRQRYYPTYGMWQISDRDILFDAERAEGERAIMEGLGFQAAKFGGENRDVYYKQPASVFVMRRGLFGRSYGNNLYEYNGDFEKCQVGSGFEKRFTPEVFYLYTIAREYGHHAGGGAGLRFLVDAYSYLQRTHLDMGYVRAEAEKLGIAEFEEANRVLALRLFSGQALTEEDRKMLEMCFGTPLQKR